MSNPAKTTPSELAVVKFIVLADAFVDHSAQKRITHV